MISLLSHFLFLPDGFLLMHEKNLKAINGGGAKTVAMTVYGNRDFEDALLELQDLLIEQNFRPVAAIAAVAQHSMMSSLAAHRPDEQDGAQLAEFAQNGCREVNLLRLL